MDEIPPKESIRTIIKSQIPTGCKCNKNSFLVFGPDFFYLSGLFFGILRNGIQKIQSRSVVRWLSPS